MVDTKIRSASLEYCCDCPQTSTKSLIQLLIQVIKRLTTEYEGMVRNIGELKNSAHHAIELEQQMQEMRQLFDTQVKQIAMLKEKLHTTEHEKNETIYNLPESNIETYKLQDILRAAIKSIKETLEVKY
jgi:ubiquinone biosynthesis protein Coq4